MKKILASLLSACMVLSMAACSPGNTSGQASTPGGTSAPAGQTYPTQSINGIVQWGAGGGTDSLMRPLSAMAESTLGASIIIQNMTGATGSIATQYVYDANADGYNLLMGAENPALYQELGISNLTYSDFTCVYLIGDETVGIVVGKNSPYNSFTEIIEAALAAPSTIKLSTTGKGGLPWDVAAFIQDVTGATFNQIPYDSDASAKTAVMSGECDFTVCKVQSGIEEYTSGDLKFLCMLSAESVDVMADVPSVLDEYPDFEKYLPWGPFYGIFVKNGTDEVIIETLSAAFTAAGAEQSYQDVLENFYINYLGYSGAEAQEYIENWQSNTVGALRSSGALED